MNWRLAAGVALLCGCAVSPACARAGGSSARPPDSPTVEQQFMTAWRRIQHNQPEPPDSPQLQEYVIHDYLRGAPRRAAVARRPDAALDEEVDGFLSTHAGLPVARALRRDWLASLAGRGRWDWFLARAVEVTEPVLLCDRLAGRLASGETAGLEEAALQRWLLAQRQPPECEIAFAWLRRRGVLTTALAEQRTRAALAAGNPRLAREDAADLPAEKAAPLLQWARLLEAPRQELTALATDPTRPVEPEALGAGFTRLAHADAAAAAELLPRLLIRTHLPAATRGQLQRAAALGAAFAHTPDAVADFLALPAEMVDAQVQEWRVRAALWAGDYERALRWQAEMTPALAAQPRWRYWRARALQATRGADAALAEYAELAGMRDYYGYLSADRLHRAYDLNMHPSADDVPAQEALAQQPGMRRAHALFDCELPDEAAAEWVAELTAARPAIKVQAAHLADRWGWYAQAIATLAQAGDWDDVLLRYPRPYRSAVAAASRLTGLAPEWIYAVMRQESLFRVDALSRTDARGLMQMEPATASLVARHWHLPAPRAQELFEPSIAVPFGAAYLRDLLDRYQGRLELALAAYNAGPVAVARWLPQRSIDADVWVENIPYGETRGYVEHVLEHIVAFSQVSGVELPRLADLMAPLGPNSPAPSTPAPESGPKAGTGRAAGGGRAPGGA